MSVTKLSSGNYRVQIRREGKSYSKTFTRKMDADRWERETRIKLDNGELISAAMTLADALNKYLKLNTIHKKGRSQETSRINCLLRDHPALCNIDLTELIPKDMTDYRDLRLQSVGANSVRLELGIISSVLNEAKKEWHVPNVENVVLSIKRPSSKGTERNRRLEADLCEEERLFDVVSKHRNPAMRSIIELAIFTAMRQGEILHKMRWENIKFFDDEDGITRGVLYLEDTKSSDDTVRSRNVPLGPLAVKSLALYGHQNRGKVFNYTSSGFRSSWGEVKKKVGLHDFHFHDLRHEAVSRLFEQGLMVMDVASISGHSSFEMLKRYTHQNAVGLAKKLK